MEKTSPPPDPPEPPAPDARTGTRGFLDATVERFVREFRADRAQLFLYDEESNTLTLRAAHGYPAFGYLGDLPQTLCEVYPSVSRVPLYRFYILDENGNRPSNLPDTNDDLAEINRIWRQAGMEFYWAGATDISNHSSYFIVNGNESFLEDLCSVMPSPNGISLGSAIDSLLMNGRGFLTHQVDIPRGRIKGFDDRDTLVHLRTGLLELDRSPSSLESSEP